MIVTARDLYDEFAWRESQPPYWIDRLSGNEQVRLAIDAGAGFDDVVAVWQDELAEFRTVRAQSPALPRTTVVRRLVVTVLTFAVALLGATATSAWSGADRDRPAVDEEGKRIKVVPPRFDTTAQDLHFQHHRLRPGTPKQAKLLAAPLAQMSADLRSFLGPSPDRPMYAGGVVLASRHGVVPVHDAAGKALRYADTETELPGRPAGAGPPRHDLRPGIGDQDVHHDRGDAAGRGRAGRPRRAGGDVPPRLRPERQGRRHDPAPAHPHRGPAGLAAALQRLPDGRGTPRRRAGRRTRRRARRGLRLLRPQPDHAGPGRRGGHRTTPGPGDRPRHHPPAAA